jgi:protein-disulfide isomerase
MKRSSLLITALVVSLFCYSAFAQEQTAPPKTPKITKKQMRQQARIKQGVQSGELTKGETIRLEKEQGKIQAEKKQAKSDGKVTPQERHKIRHDQKKTSRHIYRAKHNDKTQK